MTAVTSDQNPSCESVCYSANLGIRFRYIKQQKCLYFYLFLTNKNSQKYSFHLETWKLKNLWTCEQLIRIHQISDTSCLYTPDTPRCIINFHYKVGERIKLNSSAHSDCSAQKFNSLPCCSQFFMNDINANLNWNFSSSSVTQTTNKAPEKFDYILSALLPLKPIKV